MADSRFAQFANADPGKNPDLPWWSQKVFFNGVARRRYEIVPALAATPGMTEKAARLLLASAPVADGTSALSPPTAWFTDESLAAFYNPDQPREKGRFASGGGSSGGKGKSKGKEDGTAAHPYTIDGSDSKGSKKGKDKGDANGLKVTGRKPGAAISEKDFMKSVTHVNGKPVGGKAPRRKHVGDHAVVGHLLKEIGSNAGLRNAIFKAHNSAEIKKHLSKYQVEYDKDGKRSFLHVGKGAKPNEAIKALVRGAAAHPELRKHLEAAATRNPALRAGLEKSIGKSVKREVDKAVRKAKGGKKK